MSNTNHFCKMCKDMSYIQKFCGGCVIIMIVIIIILSVYIGISAGAQANVKMSGDQDEAFIQQSSGVHLIEVNGTNLGSKQCNGWSWVEYLCGGLFFVFVLKCTHLVHYCLLTKKLVKKKLAREVCIQMKDLTNNQSSSPVIVPGLA